MKTITYNEDDFNRLFDLPLTGGVVTIEFEAEDISSPFEGCRHTSEAKADISKAMVERWKKNPVVFSAQTRKSIAQTLTGVKQSKETIAKRVAKNKGQKRTEQQKRNIADGHKPVDYYVVSPDGDTHHITKFNRFCRENDLSAPLMNKVVKGKRKSHKGWRKAQ